MPETTLELRREAPDEVCTIGQLRLGAWSCWTLERAAEGKGRIPAGRYRLDINFSQRFQRPMPEICDVPGFDGVRIHPGNTEADTEGCVLVGMGRAADAITESVVAFDALFPMLRAACAAGPTYVEILEHDDEEVSEQKPEEAHGSEADRQGQSDAKDQQGGEVRAAG